jgi:hypothetical protein
LALPLFGRRRGCRYARSSVYTAVIMSRHPIGPTPHHSHEAGDASTCHALPTLPRSHHSSCGPPVPSKPPVRQSRALKPVTPLLVCSRVPAYLYLDHHPHFNSLQSTATWPPQIWRPTPASTRPPNLTASPSTSTMVPLPCSHSPICCQPDPLCIPCT